MDRPNEGCTSHIVGISTYYYEPMNLKDRVKTEDSFMNAYIKECFESENICSSTKILQKILDKKYKKADFKKVMKNNDKTYQNINRNI